MKIVVVRSTVMFQSSGFVFTVVTFFLFLSRVPLLRIFGARLFLFYDSRRCNSQHRFADSLMTSRIHRIVNDETCSQNFQASDSTGEKERIECRVPSVA